MKTDNYEQNINIYVKNKQIRGNDKMSSSFNNDMNLGQEENDDDQGGRSSPR
jgi:hypothetical protein